MTAPVKVLTAGMLRHRVSFDRQDYEQDESTGAMTTVWTEVAVSIPAAVEPLSGREFIAAAQAGSAVVARITIRYRAGMNPAMRVRHGETVYESLPFSPTIKAVGSGRPFWWNRHDCR